MNTQTVQYIAFLRGINVGGRTVKMDRLRGLIRELGVTNVRTYIQTGNVFFESDTKDQEKVATDISRHLAKSLGYEVAVFVRTVGQLQKTLIPNPFEEVVASPNIRLCVLFTSDPLPKALIVPNEITKGGVKMTIIKVTDREVFIVMDQSAGRPGNPVQYIEKTFKIHASARFYHTAMKILEAAKLPST